MPPSKAVHSNSSLLEPPDLDAHDNVGIRKNSENIYESPEGDNGLFGYS